MLDLGIMNGQRVPLPCVSGCVLSQTNSKLRLHYNALQRVHTTSFPGFRIHKQMPNPPLLVMGHQSVYLVLWL